MRRIEGLGEQHVSVDVVIPCIKNAFRSCCCCCILLHIETGGNAGCKYLTHI